MIWLREAYNNAFADTNTVSAASAGNSAYAQLSNVLSQDVVNKIDPYTEVKNNKYVLNDDVKKVIIQTEYFSAQEVIVHQSTY